MKRLPKNLVALVLFSILVFGFFSGTYTAKAATGATAPAATAPAATTAGTTVAPATDPNAGQSFNVVGGSGNSGIGSTLLDLGFGIGNLVVNGVYLVPIATVLYLLLGILSLLLALVGGLFDLSLSFSLFHMNDFFAAASPLNTMWALFRDTLNIFFIFILLYIAITMILGSLTSKAKATLTSVVVSALFINFSMFFAKLIIDFGNIFAVTFYNQAVAGHAGLGTTITSVILAGSHLTDAFSVLSITGQTNMLVMLILQIGLVCTGIYVFGYAFFIFAGRVVMLILLVITSPVAFVGGSITYLKEQRDDWWKEFINQVILAPMFLFFILIVVSLMSLLGQVTTAATLSLATLSPGLNVGAFLYYILVMKLLLEGMKRVKKLSNGAGDMMLKFAGGAALAVAGVATGGAALGLGAFTEGAGAAAAAAGEAGGGRAAQMAARLNFAGKNVFTKAKDVVFNNYDKTGYAGKATSLARDTVIGGVKSATGGFADLSALEKNLKKASDENTKNILNKADKMGPKKEDQEKLTKLQGQEATMNKQAQEKVAGEGAALQKEHDTHQEAADKAGSPEAASAARANVQASEAAIAKFKKNQEARLQEIKEELAKTQGVDFSEIAKLTETVKKAEGDKEKYAKQVETAGPIKSIFRTGLFVTQLTKKARTELANDIRKGKKGEKSAAELFAAAEKKRKQEAGEEEKKEEKPPEAKVNVTPPGPAH